MSTISFRLMSVALALPDVENVMGGSTAMVTGGYIIYGAKLAHKLICVNFVMVFGHYAESL